MATLTGSPLSKSYTTCWDTIKRRSARSANDKPGTAVKA
jgi:hypothetical protein